jgi:GalNAc-alpha-(1->4)-GalNAc-alpha-(1->3)-diNAcBac-PP-undecaprenol alpha-1,4-N-acetyl-D-galactosaminyltransferase
MRILYIISDLTNGGAERILVDFANYFSNKNEIYVITLSDTDSFYKFNDDVIHIKLNLLKNSHSLFDSIFSNLKRIRKIRKVIRNIKPNVIISFLTQTNIISILSTINLNIPIIITEHSIFNSKNNNTFWKILRRVTYPFANYLVVLTEDDAKNYNFIKNKKIIPNFINIKNDNFKENEKQDIILAVGRLHPVKQFDLLIKLYSKMKTSYKLYIVGEGSERNKLENLIKELNLENKAFLEGQKKNIYDYYKKAKIFVLTSKYESFSNVLLEALYFECAIVSFDCDYGPRAIIKNNKSGFLVNNEKEFIEKINILITNDNLRKDLSKNAKNRAKEFSFKKIIKKWEELIKNVSNKKK